MTTLKQALGYLQTAGGAVTGIKAAPDYPPEKAGVYPFFVTYPGRFRSVQQPQGSATTLYDIVCELHVSRKAQLSAEVLLLLSFPEAVIEALFEACNTNILAQAGIEGFFGPLQWDDVETIGFTFTVREVKIITDFT
jgi:hypothetical protein